MLKSTVQKINESDILMILDAYLAIQSETGTVVENDASQFIYNHFKKNAYFVNHPDYFGLHAIPNDSLNRQVAWALVKGIGNKTVVLIHHLDVVGVEDYKLFKENAHHPSELRTALLERPEALNKEAFEDLKTDEWLFGRGTADMKGGGSIQISIMDAYSHLDNFEGNIILLAVPDEENLSAGMRAAMSLLKQLKVKYGFSYQLMINSEPHQRKEESVGVFSGGSIGKALPFVYVRGILAHAGKSAEGFNPLGILSEFIRRTEMSLDLAEYSEDANEMAPPPTWLLSRDSKTVYDVSMPLSAFGCLSVHLLSNRIQEITGLLIEMAKGAASESANRVNESSRMFNNRTHRSDNRKPWKPAVLTFSEFINQSTLQCGEAFVTYYEKALHRMNETLTSGEDSNASATWKLLDEAIEYVGSEEPVVIIGYIPPYYPSVSYHDQPKHKKQITELFNGLQSYCEMTFNQTYIIESYFTGISDLSYASLNASDAPLLEKAVAGEMPLYGVNYHIPFKEIAECAMPCINIGPWGKDFHKISERVLKKDLLVRTPSLILCAINEALKG